MTEVALCSVCHSLIYLFLVQLMLQEGTKFWRIGILRVCLEIVSRSFDLNYKWAFKLQILNLQMLCCIYTAKLRFIMWVAASKSARVTQNIELGPFTCISSELLYLLNDTDLEVTLLMSVQRNDNSKRSQSIREIWGAGRDCLDFEGFFNQEQENN